MSEIIIISIAILGTMLTYYISVHSGKGNVMASAVVVLLAGIILEPLGTSYAGILAAASYVGMVSQEKVTDFRDCAVVGLICALIFLATDSVNVGIGGRLGTIAALSCGTFFGYQRLLENVDMPILNTKKVNKSY
ncbi:hypothetical protein [Natranaerobius trueperi]|uniref:Uncharacterized protein n=1 Tax=Natranaerobius trueperi TaxID=759412 RepID=A0A226BWW8_9FIRM|nr:hypothetical protein [Natranaerobius trueperi]OWZ83272.1 hypothetical protein CDO51_09440 [Natranaerobius trueperi]